MKAFHKIIIFSAIFAVVSIQILVYNHWVNKRVEKPPRSVEGVLDLMGWRFAEKGPVRLDGDWDFYWMQLLEPDDLMSGKAGREKDRMTLPRSWNRYLPEGKRKPACGYATFHLSVVLDASASLKALKIPDMNTSYKLWVNRELVAVNGVVGRNAREAVPQYLPKVAVFHAGGDTVDIVLQVSNFIYSLGGAWKSIVLGNAGQMIKLQGDRKAFELFLTGMLLMMCLYHFGLFFLNRREYSLLFFSLFSLLIMIRTLLTGERVLIEMFPTLNWALALKVEILPVFWGPWVFLAFLRALYPKEVSHKLFWGFFWLEIPGGFFFLLLPPDYFEAPVITFQVVLVLVSAYCFYMLIKAVLKKRSGAGFLLSGYVILFFTVVNDVLYSQFLIQTHYIIPFGLLIFILFALALQTKMVRAQEIVLKQQKELKHAEKMAVLGTLVSCVAHDINNPNNSVKMTSQALAETWRRIMPILDEYAEENGDFSIGGRMYSHQRKAVVDDFNRITRNSERIQYIVSGLKTFGRKQDDDLNAEIHINNVVETSLDLFYNERKTANKFSVRLGRNIPYVRGSYWDLVQVIINLVQNACQARVGDQGEVIVATRYDEQINKVIVSVRDFGAGIEKKVLANIREQFYTTKRESGGTGLGLFISSGIVKNHGGTLDIQSRPGRGTTVDISLDAV